MTSTMSSPIAVMTTVSSTLCVCFPNSNSKQCKATPLLIEEDATTCDGKGTTLWDSKDCHNPTVHKIGDEYVVFYIGVGQPITGVTSAGKSNGAADAAGSRGGGDDDNLKHPMADLPQSIGAAYSTSPDGPWNRMDQPLLKPEEGWECGGNPEPNCGVSNPAVRPIIAAHARAVYILCINLYLNVGGIAAR